MDPLREQSFERSLPHSSESERAILGSVLLDNALIAQAIQWLKPEDFYIPAHRRVFIAMTALFERGAEINPITIGEELKKESAVESVGGVSFITNLTYGLPLTANIAEYAKIVRDKAMLRRLVRTASKIRNEASDEEGEAEDILTAAEQMIFEVRDTRVERAVVSDRQVAAMARERLESMRPGDNAVDPAIPTPWEGLNTACRGGIHDTELWGLSAVVKNGKSVFVKQWAQYLQTRDVRSLYFSREMSEVQIMYRMLAPLTDIPVNHIRFGIDENRINRLISATRQVETGTLFWDTKSSSITDVRTRVREMIRLEKIDIVFVDYLQCFSSGKRSFGRADEIGPVWRGMKDIAQDFNTRVVAVAQFNRTGFQEERPKFHQTEGSGEAEKAVSVGLVLCTDFKSGEPGARPAAFHVDYQRDDAAGATIDLTFNGRTMEFYEGTMIPQRTAREERELGFND